MELSQAEADRLMTIHKVRADQNRWPWPTLGGSVEIPLLSQDQHDQFLLDVNRGRIDLLKITYQERCHTSIPLLRLDVRGPDHMNPDGEIIACPHLHTYREGWGTRWAVPAPSHFTDCDDSRVTIENFFDHCNIIDPPEIDFGLLA